jgi:hypothetical protein
MRKGVVFWERGWNVVVCGGVWARVTERIIIVSQT